MKSMYHTERGECIGYTWTGDKDTEVLVSGLRTYPKYRGHGFAKKVMAEICADADREGVTLMLAAHAEPWDNRMHPGLTQEQLVLFYKRFGFAFMFEDGTPEMIRHPREAKDTQLSDQGGRGSRQGP